LPLPKLHSKWRPYCAAGAALALVLAIPGCSNPSSADSADLVNGKELFIGDGTCGGCHALKRAGTPAGVGPDLDQAFVNARNEGMGESVIQGVVQEQIANPRRGSVMKPDLVTGNDARDVAAYVAHTAGKPGDDAGLLASIQVGGGADKLVKAKGGKLVIPAADTAAPAYEFGKAEAPAGRLQVEMPNPSPIEHDIAIEGPANGKGPVVGTGGTSRFTITLKAGKYEFLCTVTGHADAGMKGTLTVK
jgi:mono/diheme cytochrome c family protein/plastocyanin